MRMKVSNYIAKLLVQNGITDVFILTDRAGTSLCI